MKRRHRTIQVIHGVGGGPEPQCSVECSGFKIPSVTGGLHMYGMSLLAVVVAGLFALGCGGKTFKPAAAPATAESASVSAGSDAKGSAAKA